MKSRYCWAMTMTMKMFSAAWCCLGADKGDELWLTWGLLKRCYCVLPTFRTSWEAVNISALFAWPNERAVLLWRLSICGTFSVDDGVRREAGGSLNEQFAGSRQHGVGQHEVARDGLFTSSPVSQFMPFSEPTGQHCGLTQFISISASKIFKSVSWGIL